MNDAKRTNKYGTMTYEGFVPHLPHDGYFLPVMLDIDLHTIRNVAAYQPPLRIEDKLCFAKPGGGIFRSSLTEVES